MSKKVVLGLSGGVDSSVSALLLKQQGYQVHAVYMKNWHDDSGQCPVEVDLRDASEVANQLQLPFSVADFSKEYWSNVFEHCLDQFTAGRTPNPDVLCNREIKFNVFLKHAHSIGADYIATGHYAAILHQGETALLASPVDNEKDQTYFLHAVSQSALRQTLFPLASLKKAEVREIAKTNGLVTSTKKDSTGICFIGPKNFRTFLREYCLDRPGPIVNENNQVIAEHRGLAFYTIGQREGLNIGGMKTASMLPWFVAEKKLESNTLVVVQGGDHPRLFANQCLCRTPHWIKGSPPDLPLTLAIKTRYRQKPVQGRVTQLDGQHLRIDFNTPVRALTPGQSCVFYQEKYCLGGAEIDCVTSPIDHIPLT